MKNNILRLSESAFYNIITETVLNILKESDITNKSYPLDKLLPLIKRNGGRWMKTGNTDFKGISNFTFFMKSADVSSDKLNRIESALKTGGYTISNIGGYYDDRRLRSYIEDAADDNLFGDSSSVYDIYVVIIEPMYSKEADDEYIKNELDDTSYDYKELYKNGIFYHVTLRKYLPRIKKYGLVPKNGNTITRSRNTNDRVYLSTVPDFKTEYYLQSEDEEMNGDDMVLLKVDLSKLNKPLKLFRDSKYGNAVYTTENIPPYCIEEVSTDNLQLYEIISEKYKRIVKHNAKSYGFSISSMLNIFKTDRNIRKEVSSKLYNLVMGYIKDKKDFFDDSVIRKYIDYIIDNLSLK